MKIGRLTMGLNVRKYKKNNLNTKIKNKKSLGLWFSHSKYYNSIGNIKKVNYIGIDILILTIEFSWVYNKKNKKNVTFFLF